LAVNILAAEMHQRQRPWWSWTEEQWSETLGTDRKTFAERHCRPYAQHLNGRLLLLACAYGPGCFHAFHHYGIFNHVAFAERVFGVEVVQQGIETVADEMRRMGLGPVLIRNFLPSVLTCAFLLARSAQLTDLSTALLEQAQREVAPSLRRSCVPLSRALCRLGILAHPLPHARMGPPARAGVQDTVSAEWRHWCERWRATSTEAPKTRKGKFTILMKVGRWLAVCHPTVTSPAQWTRELAAEWVAAVERMTVGEWMHPDNRLRADQIGKPLRPNTKATLLAAVRTFLFDCQQWQWMPPNFNPRRAIRTPRSVQAQRSPNPRVITEAVWAKLVSAGLTLTSKDLPLGRYRAHGQAQIRVKPLPWYPLELVRAITLTWLFAGLRSDEIYRLRLGCIRWQVPERSAGDASPEKPPVCLLEVPVNKTHTAFVKPVDRVVGEAIEAWERKRPAAAAEWDAKTGEAVQFLFVYRGKRVGGSYINGSLIPLLCRKAGVPEVDARGPIRSHRARSTIATQLYNAREPMTLFELQAWLGHRSPATTQHYAQITPTKLSKAYQDAGYFDRNVRMIEVLLDQEAIQSGAAARGEPWKYYDLGHGYCTYDFFDQCPHRMACAKCSFYRPKLSAQGQLLEGKAHLQRMLQAIPLLEDERAAVEDGVEAMEKLLRRLAHEPTPMGQKPNPITPLVTIQATR
jgi:integrase